MTARVAIVGAGAIGGYVGAKLAAAGAQVSALARGATLAALREHGWRVVRGDGSATTAPLHAASASAAELGPKDLVVVAVKGQSLAPLAPTLAPLVAPHTVILPAMNGVLWWFGHGLPARLATPLSLAGLDPDGAVSRALPPAQVLGCVVHIAAGTREPGVVEHRMGEGLLVGEPGAGRGEGSERLDRTVALLRGAGFDVMVPESIHQALWYKLWGNVTMNPVSALTGATSAQVLDDPLVRAFCTAVMTEVGDVGARIGCAIDQTPADRHQVTRKLGAFKTSMLQDVEAGRPLELDGICDAVRDIARQVGLATPNLDALFGLTRLMAQRRGLYPLPSAASSVSSVS
jgi:2-dehydropantoate 2-reductase